MPSRSENVRFHPVFGVTAALLAVGGCVTGSSTGPGGPTQSDRLMRAYPDLQNGRFAVIADFENPAHMELVQFVGASPGAKCELKRKVGRKDTGRYGLRLETASPDDTLTLNNDNAAHWSLTRDWRPYDLLLMSIESPRPDLRASVLIAAGSSEHPPAVESSFLLERGWNLLRFDLEEIAEHLPLDDVRELKLSVAGAERPVRVHIDDIILTGNRRDLFGTAQDTKGRLYVEQVGRGWGGGGCSS